LSAERAFYASMVGVIWLLVFWGFSQSFFLRPFFPHSLSPAEPIFYVHGGLFVAWLGLLAMQTWLIGSGETSAHRRLGLLGFALVPLMLAMGLYAATVGAHRPTGYTGVPDPPLHFFGVIVAMLAAFCAFAATALMLRGRPQAHKRLMLLAAIVLAEAGVMRIPPFATLPVVFSFWATALLLVPLAAWDGMTMKRLHPATLWGGLGFLAYGSLREAAASTPAWQSTAAWAVHLLG
jgi:hypothetical protein